MVKVGGILCALLGSTLLVAGCAGADENASDGAAPVTPASLEVSLPRDFRANGAGTLRDVRCVRRDEQTFRCSGDYKASKQALEDELAGVDTTGLRDADWRALRDQRSGLVTLRVDLYDDGTYVYTPE